MKKLAVLLVAALVLVGGVSYATSVSSNETLVSKLVALCRGLTPNQIDEAVSQAKNQILVEQKRAQRNYLEKLFNSQIATIKERGVPESIVEFFQSQKSSVIAKASEMTFGDGNIPFLPVIPRTFRSPYDLMAMVRNGEKVGYTYLSPIAISDVVDNPQKPYYIYDVENGESTRGKNPEAAEKIIKQQNRFPLTAVEVIALATHTDVLSRHYVWAIDSRYELPGKMFAYLVVCLTNYSDWPLLDWDYVVNDPFGRWGSASCGSRS